MNKPEFSPLEITSAIEEITDRKVLGLPKYLENGYANENWLVETNAGKLLCKIGPIDAIIGKWRSTLKAIEFVSHIDIPTNQLIGFYEDCSLLKNRLVRIFTWVEGESLEAYIHHDEIMNRFFKQLGKSIKKLHDIKLDFFSSRLDYSKPTFKSWKDYLDYRIAEIHERAVQSNRFDIKKMNQIWDKVYDDIRIVNESITPTLTHRDLHEDNILISKNGDLAAILDFDSAEAWDPVADFYKLKWAFKMHFNAYEAFKMGYGDPKVIHEYFEKRLRIVEIIELINAIALIESSHIRMFIDMFNEVISNAAWDNPLVV